MSLTDELTQLEEHVKTRLRELKPLVDEYSELEVVAKRLGIAVPDQSGSPARPRRQSSRRASASSGSPASKRKSRGARARRARRAPAGKRREEVLAAVKERPGITVRELGEQLGVDPTSLYRAIHRLESDGLVKKARRGLEPADESTSAAPAPAATDEAGGSTSPESDATTEAASGI